MFDILDTVFAPYQGQGQSRLVPAWRFDIAKRDIYPRRSLTTQYQESDLAFVLRLMSEEGLFHYYEHSAGDGPGLGGHTLVVADHNGSFKPNAQANIDFTQPGAVMKADSLDRWRTSVVWQTNAIDMRSWDYRSRRDNQVAAHSDVPDGMRLLSCDAPGAYAYQTQAQGQRIAENQLQALEAGKEIHTAAGTVRTAAPGTTFTLRGHHLFDDAADDDARSFLVVRAVHLAYNNLSADMRASIAHELGQGALAAANEKEQAHNLHAGGKHIGERPLYRCRLDAIGRATPYRSGGMDNHGRLLHPRPTVHGQQTAIVVGPPGSVIHTDRDHRILVQMHWQRGSGSHSRLEHPAPDGHSGAPADHRAGTWVRVATPMAPVAGANWGANALPRVGQEVLVDFLEGNIDRPVVIGSLYNGKGQPDAQNNQSFKGAGAATGNAPAWFPGEGGGHAHPAVLSGFKSQALASSQSGAGAYNQLVFDDSPGQSRLSLQRHAKAHGGNDELNLGYLRHQSDNQRLAKAGFGAELKTEHSAALRAGKGMLLSSDARNGASDGQLDSMEAQAQIARGHELQLNMATTAQKHNADLKGEQAEAEPPPEKLPAIAQMAHSVEVLKGADGAGAGAQSPVTAYTEAQLQLSGPAGIAATTPGNAIFAAGNTSSVTASHDINFAAQGNSHHLIAAGISLFTYGKASNKEKPNQETGIRLHAATGKVSSQSQSGQTRITADKAVTVASTSKGVNIAAKQHVLMTAQGAYLKLEGGNIMIHGPGKMEFLASMKELAGPASSSPTLPHLPDHRDMSHFIDLNYRWDDLQPMVGAPYTLTFDNGTSIQGKLDAKGFARLENMSSRPATVTYGEDERDAVPRKKLEPNQILGAKPRTEEEAQAFLERYLAQEAAYHKDNFFPDELAEMGDAPPPDGSVSELDYDFHYDDYKYADEENPQDQQAEKDYRQLHDGEGGSA